jgi:hypothetical protein
VAKTFVPPWTSVFFSIFFDYLEDFTENWTSWNNSSEHGL